MNYPDLPRSGLLGPRLLRSGLPVSVSELASDVDTAFTRRKRLVSPPERGSGDGSRLRRRFPSTGGSECPAPTGSTLSRNRRCTLLVAFEQRRKRGEHLTVFFDRRGTKAMLYSGSETDDGRCIPSLPAPSAPAEEGGLAPCTAEAKLREALESYGRLRLP